MADGLAAVEGEAVTVREAIHTGCDSGALHGLNLQIIAVINELAPGLLQPVAHGKILAPSRVLLFLQAPARTALLQAVEEGVRVMQIASAYRPLPSQIAVYTWYREGRCGIPLASKPGHSNHEDAAAIDVQDHAFWQRFLVKRGFRWQGVNDPSHFSYRGAGFRDDVGALGVRAVQRLLNRHGAGLKEDGEFGPATESAILGAPAEGYAATQPADQPDRLTIDGAPAAVRMVVESGHHFAHIAELAANRGWKVTWNQATRTVEVTTT